MPPSSATPKFPGHAFKRFVVAKVFTAGRLTSAEITLSLNQLYGVDMSEIELNNSYTNLRKALETPGDKESWLRKAVDSIKKETRIYPIRTDHVFRRDLKLVPNASKELADIECVMEAIMAALKRSKKPKDEVYREGSFDDFSWEEYYDDLREHGNFLEEKNNVLWSRWLCEGLQKPYMIEWGAVEEGYGQGERFEEEVDDREGSELSF